MAETTGIAWTRSTFNPWIGCTEVSPGCDSCYARELDKRHRYGGATHWGTGVERYVTSLDTWLKPGRWNDIAAKERASGKVETKEPWHTPGFWPVFPSMCDPFDNEIPRDLFATFLQLMLDTPSLTWLLLSKRVGNAVKMLPKQWLANPPAHVWIGASVVNQEEADRDIPRLLATPAAKRFISYEPALEEVDFKPFLWERSTATCRHETRSSLGLPSIDQIIVGGESNQGKHRARPFVVGWARSTMLACTAAGVAFFMKQFGSNTTNREGVRHPFKDRSGSDPAEWPQDLRMQEFPT